MPASFGTVKTSGSSACDQVTRPRLPCHIVDRILEHEHLIAAADGESTTRPSLPNDHRDGGHSQTKHLPQVVGDGLALMKPHKGRGGEWTALGEHFKQADCE